jgi:hypothetical protein
MTKVVLELIIPGRVNFRAEWLRLQIQILLEVGKTLGIMVKTLTLQKEIPLSADGSCL